MHSACCFCYRAAATHPKRTSPGPAWLPLPAGGQLAPRTTEATPNETAVADWRETPGRIMQTAAAASRRPGQAFENRPSARPLLLLLSLRAAWHVAPRWTIVSKDPSDRVDAPSSSVVAISSAGEVAPQTRRRRRASTLAAQHKRCGRSNVTGRACCGRRNALRGRASATILGSR